MDHAKYDIRPEQSQDGNSEMSAHQRLWQAVVITAIYDATLELTPKMTKSKGVKMRDKRAAHAWIAKGGEDFRHACCLAGLEWDIVRDAYLQGKLDGGALRDARYANGGRGKHNATKLEAE